MEVAGIEVSYSNTIPLEQWERTLPKRGWVKRKSTNGSITFDKVYLDIALTTSIPLDSLNTVKLSCRSEKATGYEPVYMRHSIRLKDAWKAMFPKESVPNEVVIVSTEMRYDDREDNWERIVAPITTIRNLTELCYLHQYGEGASTYFEFVDLKPGSTSDYFQRLKQLGIQGD